MRPLPVLIDFTGDGCCKEALTFSDSIQAITLVHIKCFNAKVIQQNMIDVVNPLVEWKNTDHLHAWSPGGETVSIAVDVAAQDRFDNTVKTSVEGCLLSIDQATPPICHLMNGIIQTQLPHLCTQSDFECIV